MTFDLAMSSFIMKITKFSIDLYLLFKFLRFWSFVRKHGVRDATFISRFATPLKYIMFNMLMLSLLAEFIK